MVTLSLYVLIGIVEVFFALLVTIVLLIVFHRRSKQRVKLIKTQLTQLKEAAKDLVPSDDSESLGYADHLTKEIDETRVQFNQFSDADEITLEPGQPDATRLAALRYLFLQAEMEADQVSGSKKWDLLARKLEDIVIGSGSPEPPASKPVAAVDQDLLEKWPELCDAAVQVWGDRSRETEDNFIALMQLINSDLGFDEIEISERKTETQKRMAKHNSKVDLNKIKDIAQQQKQIISNLLSERNAAESEVTVKVDELKKLQRFLNEGEVCIKQLETEITSLQGILAEERTRSEECNDMQDLLQNFARENSEMLTCIETLEKQNKALRSA